MKKTLTGAAIAETDRKPYHESMTNDTFALLQRAVFLGLLASITILFVWMLSDFALPILWAVVFAVVFLPLYHRILSYVPERPTIASLSTICIVLIFVFGPISALGAWVADDAVSFYRLISEQGVEYVEILQEKPAVTATLGAFGLEVEDVQAGLVESARTAAAWVAIGAFDIGLRTLVTVVQFVLMLYILFFLLRDGERLSHHLIRSIPLARHKAQFLFDRFASTTRAIVRGTLITAFVQGLVGGLVFWIAGIPNPTLWGALMMLLAAIPAVGPVVIWLPAGLLMIAIGGLFSGIFIIVGGIVISLLDNVLKPLLIGRDTKMSDAVILLSILGGIVTFGIAGLVLGPVIAALFLAAWSLFEREFSKELEEQHQQQ